MKLKANSFVALMIGGLKTLRLVGPVAWLLISTQVINAQESAKFEKIRDVSPDNLMKKPASSVSFQRRRCHRKTRPWFQQEAVGQVV
jgi:hypothetical protein